MDRIALHQDYIRKNGVTTISIYYSELLTDLEIAFLTKYYKWGLGLVKGHIPPTSNQHKELVSKYHKFIKNVKNPPQKNDQWFKELSKEQQAWVKYYYVQQLGYKVLSFKDLYNFSQSQWKT